MTNTQKSNLSKFTEIMLLAFPGYIIDTDYNNRLLKVRVKGEGWIMVETPMLNVLNDIRDMMAAIHVYKRMDWEGAQPGYRDLKIERNIQ